MSNINELIKTAFQTFKVPRLMEQLIDPIAILELARPDLKDNEFAVKSIDKHREKKLNPKSNRIKTFKTSKWVITYISPEHRTLKNLPRDSSKKPKVRFQDWLEFTNTSRSNYSVGLGCDGKWYGYSHRAIHGYKIGDSVKPGDMGNKYDDPKKSTEKKFEPYIIKTDDEAFEHAERFAKSVS